MYPVMTRLAPGAGPESRSPASAAVVRLSSIGDTVHVLPVIASLRDAWPDIHLTWVIQPVPHTLMRGRPDVDEFVLFDRSSPVRGLLDVRRVTRDRRFDFVLAPHVSFKAGLVTAMLRSDRKIGYDRARAPELNWLFTSERIDPRPPGHVQDEYLEFVEHLGIEPKRRWEFHFTEEELAARDALLDSLDGPALAVVLHSSRDEKNWPADRYARVLEMAETEFGLRPLLVGSAAPAEVAVAEEVTRRTRARPVNALADDLRGLAALLDGCALALAPDTGPLHIAVALGTPTIGLYGFTDPKRVGPYRRYADLTIDRFSRPGETAPSTESRPGNMEKITVEDVAEKLELAVTRYLADSVAATEMAVQAPDAVVDAPEAS